MRPLAVVVTRRPSRWSGAGSYGRSVGWDVPGAHVLVTGGTSGIGRAAATELAARGATVMITARDQQKGRQTAAAIRAAAGVDVEVGLLDLSSLESVRRFAAEFLATHDRLDVLVNNAGTMTGRRMETVDGLEWTFGVNHVGAFLLTALLTDRLVSSAPARVISASSEVHRSVKRGLDFTDLQMTRGWSAQKAYAASKLATVLMTVELDRRLAGRVEHEDRHGPRRARDGETFTRQPQADRTRDAQRRGVAIYFREIHRTSR